MKFPFEDTMRGGVFDVNKITTNAVRDDMLSLLTTKRGQRVMRPALFSPIYDYLFEPMDELSLQELNTDIKAKINEFIPQVEVHNINFTIEENALLIEIVFSVKKEFISRQTLVIAVPLDSPGGEIERVNN